MQIIIKTKQKRKIFCCVSIYDEKETYIDRYIGELIFMPPINNWSNDLLFEIFSLFSLTNINKHAIKTKNFKLNKSNLMLNFIIIINK